MISWILLTSVSSRNFRVIIQLDSWLTICESCEWVTKFIGKNRPHEVDGKKEYGAHRAKPGREKGSIEHFFYIGNHWSTVTWCWSFLERKKIRKSIQFRNRHHMLLRRPGGSTNKAYLNCFYFQKFMNIYGTTLFFFQNRSVVFLKGLRSINVPALLINLRIS